MLVLRELMTQGYPEFECLRKGEVVRYWVEMLEPVNEKKSLTSPELSGII